MENFETMTLLQLADIPESLRDEKWEGQFLTRLTESSVKVLSPDPQYGPDSWPYLMVETAPDASEPSQKILHWLSSRGMGLAVNPTKEIPDYVFSYGMIWSFRETGYFFKNVKDSQESGVVQFSPGQIVEAGEPTKEYLPDYVRKIMRDFFRDQGILAPRILLISTDRSHYDLAISLESLGNPPEAEHAGVAEAVGWFLPPHYSLMLVSEKGLPAFYDI